MIDPAVIRQASLRLLEPYTISPETPYLSEGQQVLCRMNLEERITWSAEWLKWAAKIDDWE
jgi:hypothetical protein